MLQVSDEYVQLTNREKSLYGQVQTEQRALSKIIKAIENQAETKIAADTPYNGSLNIYQQHKGVGLRFETRDLVVARTALKQHGLMERFRLKTQPKQIQVKKIDLNDPLLPFIPEEYKNVDVLPPQIALDVF